VTVELMPMSSVLPADREQLLIEIVAHWKLWTGTSRGTSPTIRASKQHLAIMEAFDLQSSSADHVHTTTFASRLHLLPRSDPSGLNAPIFAVLHTEETAPNANGHCPIHSALCLDEVAHDGLAQAASLPQATLPSRRLPRLGLVSPLSGS
jgi:hypothetical protein